MRKEMHYSKALKCQRLTNNEKIDIEMMAS